MTKGRHFIINNKSRPADPICFDKLFAITYMITKTEKQLHFSESLKA